MPQTCPLSIPGSLLPVIQSKSLLSSHRQPRATLYNIPLTSETGRKINLCPSSQENQTGLSVHLLLPQCTNSDDLSSWEPPQSEVLVSTELHVFLDLRGGTPIPHHQLFRQHRIFSQNILGLLRQTSPYPDAQRATGAMGQGNSQRTERKGAASLLS